MFHFHKACTQDFTTATLSFDSRTQPQDSARPIARTSLEYPYLRRSPTIDDLSKLTSNLVPTRYPNDFTTAQCHAAVIEALTEPLNWYLNAIDCTNGYFTAQLISINLIDQIHLQVSGHTLLHDLNEPFDLHLHHTHPTPRDLTLHFLQDQLDITFTDRNTSSTFECQLTPHGRYNQQCWKLLSEDFIL